MAGLEVIQSNLLNINLAPRPYFTFIVNIATAVGMRCEWWENVTVQHTFPRVDCCQIDLVARRGYPLRGCVFRVVTGRKRCYVLASIAFWGQKAVCWDNSKPLKVSGIFLTSAVVSQWRCLLGCVIADTESI